MYNVVAICGEAGSGKDSVLNALLKTRPALLNPIVSCTTRPPRQGEKNGINYNFLSIEEFTDKLMNDEMLEASCFNSWMYGTEIASLKEDKVNIGVFNPEAIENLALNKNIKIWVYYLNVSDKERIIRQLQREENPDIFEIFRRYKTDCEDFSNLNFSYNELLNQTKEDFDNAIKIIISDIEKLVNFV